MTGVFATCIIQIMGCFFVDRHGECSHRWQPWSEPDSQGNQVRSCKRCNLQEFKKGEIT